MVPANNQCWFSVLIILKPAIYSAYKNSDLQGPPYRRDALKIQKQRAHIRPSSTDGSILLFFLVIMLFLSNLSVLFQSSSADPTIQDNGDGTITGRWTFQDPLNYTYQNLSLSPGKVTLMSEYNATVDTTMEDFNRGFVLYNINITSSPGNVTLNNTILGAPPKIVEIPIDFGNGMDAYIDESFTKKNYGASVVLELDIAKKTRMIMRFDTSGIQNPQWINKSEVWIMPIEPLSGMIPANISVHEVYTDWLEGTGTGNPTRDGATWETTDGSNLWLTMGGDFNAVPEYTLKNMTNQPVHHKWNITRLVKEWVNGTTPNYGVLFEIQFGGVIADLKSFFSKEYSLAQDRPKLVVYYNATGPSQANGTFISRIMDAQSNVRWGNISWDSVVPPGTELFTHTRSGDCTGSWSGWSQAYLTPSGSQIASNPNRCLQYKAEMVTYVNGTRPMLEEVRIEYSSYLPEGSVETEDFTPIDWLGWEDFNASFTEPLGTNVTFQYSTNAGMFWTGVFAGESLQPLLAQTIRFRSNFKSSDQSKTPELYEMNVTYRVKTVLDHIHMSRSNWTGTTDGWVDIDATGHDSFHQNVSFIQKWETDDPWGSVNSTGVYVPGRVGSWRVFCNNSDDSVSNYTMVTVLPGTSSRIAVNPWDPGTVTTDDTLMFNVTGYDSKGNSLGPAMANWSVTGGIGSVIPGPDSWTILDPTQPGSGQIWADDGLGHTNSTDIIQVVAGARSRIGIEPWSPGTLTADESVNLTAYEFDGDGNQIGTASVSWTVNGGIGTVLTGPSITTTFEATTLGSGTVTIDDGLGHTNTSDTITVIARDLASIIVQPDNITLLIGDFQNFSATGYDVDGNEVTLIGPLWNTNAGNIIGSSPTSATLKAQDTVNLNGWIQVTAVNQNNITGIANLEVVNVNVMPNIVGAIPDQVKPEDYGSWSVDLSPFASDPQDPLSDLSWSFTEQDSSMYTISGDGVTGNHMITFVTILNAYGVDEITAWLVDIDGNSDSQTFYVNITPENDRPIIQSITPFSVHYDVPYSYYFYDYVSDIETPTERLSLTSSDPDHISFNGLWGEFLYPEAFNSVTVYPFVTVQDEDGGEMSTVLAVTVSDDHVPVVTQELPDVFLFEGQEVKNYFDLDDYFEDPDQDSLFYTSGNIRVEITIEANHSVNFRAPPDWHGQEIVSFRAIDPENARAEDIVLVTVFPVNDPPTISGVPNLMVHYDDAGMPEYNYTFDLMPYVDDVDNDTSELIITTSDPSNIYFFEPQEMVMAIHYPESMKGQVVTVRITVSDGLSEAYQDIEITISDDWPPEIESTIPDKILFEDTPLLNDFNISDFFRDPDGDELTFSSSSTNVFAWIDESSHIVSFNSTKDWFGLENVTFRAMDADGGIAEQTIEVMVLPVNDAPVILDLPDPTVMKGETHTLDLTDYVYDVDNLFSDLTITATGNYSKMTLSIAGSVLIFSFPQEGTYVVWINVSDGYETANAFFTVTVVGPPPPSIWEQIYWPWSLIIAVLLCAVLLVLTRGYFAKMFIDETFLIYRNGSLIHHAVVGKQTDIDEDIFSGMLTAIQEFIRDSFKRTEDSPVKRVEFGERKIAIERGKYVFLAVVYSGHGTKRNLRPIKDAIKHVEMRHAEDLDGWNGFVGAFSDVGSILEKHLGNLGRSPDINDGSAGTTESEGERHLDSDDQGDEKDDVGQEDSR
jgi:hypothetical protein